MEDGARLEDLSLLQSRNAHSGWTRPGPVLRRGDVSQPRASLIRRRRAALIRRTALTALYAALVCDPSR